MSRTVCRGKRPASTGRFSHMFLISSEANSLHPPSHEASARFRSDHMFLISSEANSLHLSSVEPGMSRARS